MKYATNGMIVSEKEPNVLKPGFASEYDELIWLAEKQKGSLSDEETLRFYELRDKWPEMHSDGDTIQRP